MRFIRPASGTTMVGLRARSSWHASQNASMNMGAFVSARAISRSRSSDANRSLVLGQYSVLAAAQKRALKCSKIAFRWPCPQTRLMRSRKPSWTAASIGPGLSKRHLPSNWSIGCHRAAADFRRATVRIGLSWETVPSLRRWSRMAGRPGRFTVSSSFPPIAST